MERADRHARPATAGIRGIAAQARRLALAAVMLLAAGGLAACDSAEERAEQHYQSGVELLAEGNPVKAQLEFRNALQLNKEHVGANLELARMAREDGNLPRTLRLYRRVAELDETIVEAHVQVGRILLAANRVDDALKSSIAAFELAPRDPDVLVLKSSTAIKLENFDAARETIEDGLEIDPGNAELIVLQAAIERDAGNLEQAIAIIRDGLAQNPGNVPLSVLQIDTLVRMNRPDDVTEAIETLIADQPEQTAFREAQVRWLISRGNYAEAEEALRELARIEPDNPQRHLDVVRLMLPVRGADVALKELDRLITEADSPTEAYPFLSAKVEYLIRRGELVQAEDLLLGAIDRLGDSEHGNEARLQLARLKIAGRDIDAARPLVDEVIQRDKASPGALTLRGRLAIIDEDYDAAIGDLRAALDTSPDYVEALHMLSLAHQRNGSRQLAGQRLADAVEVSEHDPRSALLYAQHLLREQRLDVAETVLAESLRLNPLNRDVMEALAKVRLALQDWVGAEELAEQLRQMDAGALDDRIRAASLLAQDKTDEGLEVLRDAAVDSGSLRDLSALIGTYLRTGRVEEARSFLDAALVQNPGSSEILRLKGVVAENEGDMEAAEANFRAAIEAESVTPRAYASLGRFQIRQKEIDAAEETVRAGIEATDSHALRMTLAGILERRGDIDGAIEQYEVVYASRSSSEVVANNLASLISDNDPTPEDIERAFNIAKRLRDSEVPHYKDTLGWILFKRGDTERALVVIGEAAEALPNNPVVHYHLGAVQAKLGQTERARRSLEKALELGAGRALVQLDDARALLAELGPEGSGSGSGSGDAGATSTQ